METLTRNLCLYLIMSFGKISMLRIQIWFIAWLSVLKATVSDLPQWCRGQYSCRSSTGYTWLHGCNSRLHGRAADSSSIWTVWEGSKWRKTTRWMNSKGLCTVHCLMVQLNQRSVLEHRTLKIKESVLSSPSRKDWWGIVAKTLTDTFQKF